MTCSLASIEAQLKSVPGVVMSLDPQCGSAIRSVIEQSKPPPDGWTVEENRSGVTKPLSRRLDGREIVEGTPSYEAFARGGGFVLSVTRTFVVRDTLRFEH